MASDRKRVEVVVNILAFADDPKRGMTFRELREFVQDGMRHDVPDDARVRSVATWRQSIKRLEVRGETSEGGTDATTD